MATKPSRGKKVPAAAPAAATVQTNELIGVHTRLFKDSVEALKQAAASSGIPWQVELRLLVRRALRNERRDVLVIKE